jgi:hypothetical protein
MDLFDKFLLLLKEDQLYQMIYQGKGDYSVFVKRQEALGSFILDKYLKCFKESLFREIGGKKHAISEIERIFETLRNCCKSFLSGDIAKAISLMYDCYFKEETLLKRIALDRESTFFRMRKASGYQIFSEKEMFHIPFELNHLIKNERFSISGFPSLYLGKSIYVCWEEMDRPDFDHANIALYKNREECIVIDLCMPTKKEDIMTSLFTLPLILSSSLPVLHPESDFKPEYIIPQLLMQCLVRYNKESDKAIDGIRYDSIHKYNQDSFYDYNEDGMESVYENYVFPARLIVDEGHCPVLSKLFICGYTNSFGRYELEDYELTKNHDKDNSIKNNYKWSKFHAMEKYLMFQTDKHGSFLYDSKKTTGMLARGSDENYSISE